MSDTIEGTLDYLTTGGLGEVIGFTSIAMGAKEPKVQMDTDMALALCLLADEALKARALGVQCGEAAVDVLKRRRQ